MAMRRSQHTPKTGENCSVVGWGYTTNVKKVLFLLWFRFFTRWPQNVSFTFFNSKIAVQDENAEISYDLLKTTVNVMDINFCNSSRSYEGAMKPGMFCAGRQKEGLLRNISKENQNVSNLHTNLYNSLHFQVDTMLVR